MVVVADQLHKLMLSHSAIMASVVRDRERKQTLNHLVTTEALEAQDREPKRMPSHLVTTEALEVSVEEVPQMPMPILSHSTQTLVSLGYWE